MSSLLIEAVLTAGRVLVGVSETEAQVETMSEARAFFREPGRIHLVVLLLNEADGHLVRDLEREVYPFGSERNNLFHNRLFRWSHLPWSVVSVPSKEERLVGLYLKRRGHYLDRNQYAALSWGETESFPFAGDNFRIIRPATGRIAAIGKR